MGQKRKIRKKTEKKKGTEHRKEKIKVNVKK
jgi:hypothetical protein